MRTNQKKSFQILDTKMSKKSDKPVLPFSFFSRTKKMKEMFQASAGSSASADGWNFGAKMNNKMRNVKKSQKASLTICTTLHYEMNWLKNLAVILLDGDPSSNPTEASHITYQYCWFITVIYIMLMLDYIQCDQIWWFIGLWATF